MFQRLRVDQLQLSFDKDVGVQNGIQVGECLAICPGDWHRCGSQSNANYSKFVL